MEHVATHTADRTVAVVIPARLGSVRLCRKLLLNRTGKPLIVHTAEAAAAADIGQIYVATDSEEIADAVGYYGFAHIMTGNCQSGTARVAAALTALPNNVTHIINLQADEPEIDQQALVRLVASLGLYDVVTLAAPIVDAYEMFKPSIVKVVIGTDGRALYFSRSSIPWHERYDVPPYGWRHVGVYGFERDTLVSLSGVDHDLVKCEGLEQLAWLAHGYSIGVSVIAATHPGIDVLDDYDGFHARYTQRHPRSRPEGDPAGGL